MNRKLKIRLWIFFGMAIIIASGCYFINSNMHGRYAVPQAKRVDLKEVTSIEIYGTDVVPSILNSDYHVHVSDPKVILMLLDAIYNNPHRQYIEDGPDQVTIRTRGGGVGQWFFYPEHAVTEYGRQFVNALGVISDNEADVLRSRMMSISTNVNSIEFYARSGSKTITNKSEVHRIVQSMRLVTGSAFAYAKNITYPFEVKIKRTHEADVMVHFTLEYSWAAHHAGKPPLPPMLINYFDETQKKDLLKWKQVIPN